MRFAFVSLPIAEDDVVDVKEDDVVDVKEDDVVDVKEDDDATQQHCAWFLGDFSEF
jgi:hypothetical protein